MNRTKRKIFNTAVKLFAEKGYDNASTDLICYLKRELDC